MRYARAGVGVIVVIIGTAFVRASGASRAAAVDVPGVGGVTIDGKADDWGDGGFRIDWMTSPSAVAFEPADLSAWARVGWDPRGGMLVLVQVRDSVREENPADKYLGRFDSVELFVSSEPGSRQRYQLTIAAGAIVS